MILIHIMLTVYFAWLIMETEHTFGQANSKEDFAMTDHELELLYIIRNSENPEKTLQIALELMIDFLVKHEVPQDTSSVRPPESA